jgi:hypothetical protein
MNRFDQLSGDEDRDESLQIVDLDNKDPRDTPQGRKTRSF